MYYYIAFDHVLFYNEQKNSSANVNTLTAREYATVIETQ